MLDARNYKSHLCLKETEVCCLCSVGQDEDSFVCNLFCVTPDGSDLSVDAQLCKSEVKLVLCHFSTFI